MQRALRELGRPPHETGVRISLARPLASVKDKQFVIGRFRLDSAHIDRLMDGAYVSVVRGVSVSTSPTGGDNERQQLRAIVGPVYVIYDDSLRPLERGAAPPVLSCSVPGINMSYSHAEMVRYSVNGKLEQRRYTVRTKVILAHVLACMQAEGVEYPVLCAIGCGAFKGRFGDVPHCVAQATAAVLMEGNFRFKAVVFCLPGFGAGDNNFSVFSSVFAEHDKRLPVPVMLVEDRGMLAIANRLRALGAKAGVLNPSDCDALHPERGFVGMYWDNGHVALEETMALTTTLLFQHRGVNPGLFAPERLHSTDLYAGLADEAAALDPCE